MSFNRPVAKTLATSLVKLPMSSLEYKLKYVQIVTF